MHRLVIPAGKRVSSAMDGKLKSIHGSWIPAIHAGMTLWENSTMKYDKVELIPYQFPQLKFDLFCDVLSKKITMLNLL